MLYLLFYNIFIINLHIRYQHVFEKNQVGIVNDKNKQFLIDQANKSNKKEMLFQFLLLFSEIDYGTIYSTGRYGYERGGATTI